MKKKNLLKIACLSLTLLLTGCSDIVANPKNSDEPLVTFADGSKYFQNDYDKVYKGLVDSSTYNTMVLNHIVEKIVAQEIDNADFFENVTELRKDLIEEALLTKLNSDSYKTDKLFSEKKFLNSISSSLYDIKVENTHEDIIVRADTTVSDLLGEDYATTYKTYIDNEILPDINKKLLTAKYICQNSFSSLGRAYARKVSYIKLENMSKKPGAASQLINKWLGDFVDNKVTTTEDFDLDSLARIYKGVNPSSLNEKEQAYLDGTTFEAYTLSDEISDEIEKICDISANYQMKVDIDIDTSIENKYTSNGTYTLAWGHELALRDLAAKKISDSGLYTKTNGISDLPSDITTRLFSSSISSYVKTVTYGENNAKSVSFLTPQKSENGNDIGQYYFFDSSTNAYYIVVVENYNYTSTKLKDSTVFENNENKSGEVKKIANDTARIAFDLASSSSYSSEAMLDVLEKYGVAKNIHDKTFYDYMKANYGDLFDKK